MKKGEGEKLFELSQEIRGSCFGFKSVDRALHGWACNDDDNFRGL